MFHPVCSELTLHLEITTPEEFLMALRTALVITKGKLYWEEVAGKLIEIRPDDLVYDEKEDDFRYKHASSSEDGWIQLFPRGCSEGISVSYRCGYCDRTGAFWIGDTDYDLFPAMTKLARYFNRKIVPEDGGHVSGIEEWLERIGISPDVVL